MANSTSYTEAVAAAVRAAIDSAGTTINAVALAIHMPQVTLHRRLAGEGDDANFRLGELDRIATHLNIPVEQFSAPARAA